MKAKAPKPTWTWADYHRLVAREERAAARKAAKEAARLAEATAAQLPQGRPAARSESEDIARAEARAEANKEVEAQEIPTADSASGCKGRAAEVSIGPAPVKGGLAPKPAPHEAVKARQSRVEPPTFGQLIDLSRAPSGMEEAAKRWEGAPAMSGMTHTLSPPARNQVLCRCGSRFGKGSGFVPSWFGDKCARAIARCAASPSERWPRNG